MAMEKEQGAAKALIRSLEDNSIVLMEDWVKELRETRSALLSHVSEEELRGWLYSFILRVIRFLGDSQQVTVLRAGSESDLRQLFYETLCSLVGAIEAQVESTAGHSQRVKGHAVKIAGMLGLRDEEIADVEFAAAVQNVGLINDAHKLYLQPRQLDERELRAAQHHCVVGAEILRPIEFMGKVVPMVLYHHTNYDGTGFPGGVVGEQIPLGARIIRICDAFQAMLSSRPYRPAMPVSQALAEIDRSSGKQFDPKLVSLIHMVAKGVKGVGG